jgi:hypothetical protein
MRLFYDSAEPQLIPDDLAKSAYGCAAYRTGYPWPPSQVARFRRHFYIVQTPVSPSSYAKLARCIDVETYAVDPGEVHKFVKTRQANGFSDATVYCGEEEYLAIRKLDPTLHFRLWAADWTGSPHRVTWGEGDEALGCWATQFDSTDDYDTSVLYGEW